LHKKHQPFHNQDKGLATGQQQPSRFKQLQFLKDMQINTVRYAGNANIIINVFLFLAYPVLSAVGQQL